MRRFRIVIAIACVALVGLVNLPLPLFGDQALVTVFASMMSDGAVLYVDVWDPKQPAIFVFYLLAGESLGYSEVGLRAFEILWWVTLAVVLAATLQSVLRSQVAVIAVVLLTVGGYFLIVRPDMMGQVEGLVNLPLYLAMWFAYSPMRVRVPERYRLILFGFFGGVTVMFKLMFLPIIVGFWLVMILDRRRNGQTTERLFATTGWITLGMALPLTLAIGYFAWSGAMEELLWTTFVFPLQAVSAEAATKSVLFLARSAFWFGRLFLTMGLLSAVGLWHVLRHRRTEFDNLTIMWLVAGSVVILVQRSSWWHYHFLLLVVPLGLLAGRGVDWLAGEWSSIRVRVRVGVPIVLVAAMVPAMYVMMAKAVPLIRNDFALTQLGKERYETAVSPSYGAIRIDGSFLDESDALPGSIYVFGDPTYNYLFKRDQAIPINGWSPEYWNEEVWDRAHTDLVTVVPPYVRVASWAAELMEEHHSSTASFLETRYTILSRTPSGTWYQR